MNRLTAQGGHGYSDLGHMSSYMSTTGDVIVEKAAN